jgi:hypothetical protein
MPSKPQSSAAWPTCGLHEGLNNKVRLIIRRAYGFHNAQNALAMIMLVCGPAARVPE